MRKSLNVPKVHSGTCDGTYKDPKKSFIDFPDPSENVLGQANARGRSDASESPLGATFWPKNKNLCGAVRILYFIGKTFLLVILQTLFNEKYPFPDHFDQILFLVTS